MKKPIVAGGAALSLAAVFAASSIGDQGSSRPGSFDRNYERVPVHRVDAPSASGSAIAGASKKKKGKPKVRYFETEPQAVPTPRRDIATQCPAKHKALSGYFLSPGG